MTAVTLQQQLCDLLKMKQDADHAQSPFGGCLVYLGIQESWVGRSCCFLLKLGKCLT